MLLEFLSALLEPIKRTVRATPEGGEGVLLRAEYLRLKIIPHHFLLRAEPSQEVARRLEGAPTSAESAQGAFVTCPTVQFSAHIDSGVAVPAG